jgi:hypothetical protein
MKEGLFLVVELLAMLLLLLKVIKKPKAGTDADLGIFDYIQERPADRPAKPESQPRA